MQELIRPDSKVAHPLVAEDFFNSIDPMQTCKSHQSMPTVAYKADSATL